MEMPYFRKQQTEQVSGLFQLLKKDEKVNPVEIEVIRKNGKKIWVEVDATTMSQNPSVRLN